MKRFALFVLCSLVFCWMVSPPPASANNDDTAIRAALDAWAKAFAKHDIDGVMDMYGDNVIAYDIVPPLEYKGKAAYRKDYQEFMNAYDGPITIDMAETQIWVSGDMAAVLALEHVGGKMKSNGQRSDIWLRATSIFKKMNGKWKDVHDHISVPADMETGKAVLDLKP